MRKLHESINKTQESLILITLEHIEYLQVTEVTKGYLSRISGGRWSYTPWKIGFVASPETSLKQVFWVKTS